MTFIKKNETYQYFLLEDNKLEERIIKLSAGEAKLVDFIILLPENFFDKETNITLRAFYNQTVYKDTIINLESTDRLPVLQVFTSPVIPGEYPIVGRITIVSFVVGFVSLIILIIILIIITDKNITRRIKLRLEEIF